MKDLFHHFFLPHHTNNQRPKLLHYDSVFIFVILFLAATLVVTSVKRSHPQVLGTTINIVTQDLLQLTNKERQKEGVAPLSMNDQLTRAAQMKAKDMFAQNYWAHNSPTGKMPWDFIRDSGYDYIYAGENLARGFSSAKDVVTAWMNSPSHRENMLSANYRDVGFALEEGSLTGEKDTILVVEEFGSTTAAVPPTNPNKTLGSANSAQAPVIAIQNKPFIDTRSYTKNIALGIIFLFISVFIIDILIIERKKIVRFVGHNLDHILFLSTVAVVIVLLQWGAVI